MSVSTYTKAKIFKSFFPERKGNTAYLDGRPVVRYDEGDPDCFALKDAEGNYLWLYFKEDRLDMFDYTHSNWDAVWMQKAILEEHARKVTKLPAGPAKMPKNPKEKISEADKAVFSGRLLKKYLQVSVEDLRKRLEPLHVTVIETAKMVRFEGGDAVLDYLPPGFLPLYGVDFDNDVDTKLMALKIPYTFSNGASVVLVWNVPGSHPPKTMNIWAEEF